MNNQFVLYGERCSGTKLLQEIICKNLDVEVTWKYGWKHWYGGHSPEFGHDFSKEYDGTPVVGIVRNPITWLNSFYNMPHHVDPVPASIHDFLTRSPFISTWQNREIERYDDVFHLRRCKNEYLLDVIKKFVSKYILVRYEDLRDHQASTIRSIQSALGLRFRDQVVDTLPQPHIPKPVVYSPETISEILSKLDRDQEARLGYPETW